MEQTFLRDVVIIQVDEAFKGCLEGGVRIPRTTVMRLPAARKDAHSQILEPGHLLVFVAGQAPI